MSPAPFELVLGTKNRHKAAEIRRMLGDLPVQILDLTAFAELPDVDEAGQTFAENAVTKAAAFARMTGLHAIADDSGLEVDALGGAPGILSARFAGPKATDRENNDLLLRNLAGKPAHERTARFRCVLAFASPANAIFTAQGVVEGIITEAPRGANGFGYDPLFYYPDFGRTFGEVAAEMKDQVSHRARALAQFKRLLADHITMPNVRVL